MPINDARQAGFGGGNRKVRYSVRLADQVSGTIINGGGVFVLVSILGIFAYLAYVVIPLFSRGEVGQAVVSEQATVVGQPILDPYQRGVAFVSDEGMIELFDIASGRRVSEPVPVSEGQTPTAIIVNRNGQLVAAGFADGTVRFGSIGFSEGFVQAQLPSPGQTAWIDDGLFYEMVSQDRARTVGLIVKLGKPVELSEGEGPVIRLDYQIDTTGREVLVAVREDGTVLVNTVRTTRPLGGGEPIVRLTSSKFQVDPRDIDGWYFVTSDTQHVLAVSEDGFLKRYTRGDDGFVLVEEVRGVEDGLGATAATMILGGQSVLIGDSDGYVSSWHVGIGERDGQPNVLQLSRAHRFKGSNGPVANIAPSLRDRSVVILGQDGMVRVRHVTSEKIVVEFETGFQSPAFARISPKNDGVIVVDDDGRIALRHMEEGYPEFSFKSTFQKVHYEGQLEPQYVYQSSSASDSSETKLSIVPLIFGTIKATVFAMLFAVPMGVLAAVYTSEFLSPNVRKVVKPGVEMMASLPSVVLGFVAAIIVAPYAREWLPQVLVCFATLPIAVLGISHLWQLIPGYVRKRFNAWQQMVLVLLACVVGVLLAVAIGPSFERMLFAPPEGLADGNPVDMRRWLNGEYGSAWPGWFVVLIGPLALVLTVLQSMFLTRRLDRAVSGLSERAVAGTMLLRFVAMLGLTMVVSLGMAHLLQALGYDPRDSIFGPFSPRNTLVVSLIMGFAVIPIIYTISEDSLRAVPDSLRTASLGSGATPWQTALRIVIPVAGSGIFSACMIGFGRAAGETMIVLMATGNTPEMSWNLFGGFRTLSANIAVELPEAPNGSTHYRVLFLCGLVLFLMTFAVNTAAEVVRQIVRARTAGL